MRAVVSRFEQLTALKPDGSFVFPGAEKFRLFTSDKITSIDLSAIGHLSPVFNDDNASILNLCASLEVGAVMVYNCPGFEFMYFAQQGGVELKRLKDFMGNAAFYPIIGYYSGPAMDAGNTQYSIFEHDIRGAYMRWRLGVEQAGVANHVNGMHVLIFLKRWHEQVLHDRPKATQDMIQMYRHLYDGCTRVPSLKRAKTIVSFLKHVPVSALSLLSCADAECTVLSQRVLDKPWKSAMLLVDVVCKLMDGLVRLQMPDRYFDKVFDAYKAKGDASEQQAAAIVRFERELSGGAGPFSEAGVASGNRCSGFALFSECRANDIADGSQDDGRLGDMWNGLSEQVKGMYASVATTIVAGQQLQDLKTQVDAQVQVQGRSFIPSLLPPLSLNYQ